MKHKTLRTLLCVILTVCFCLSAIVPASAAGLFGGDSGAATGWDQLIRGLKDLKDRIIEKNPGTDETPAEPMEGTGTDGFYRIVHLDCGRKYFSKDWIIALINEMSAHGYTHLELAIGNDGLRFLLDDMSIEGYDFSSDAVSEAIHKGNLEYNNRADKFNGQTYSSEKNELTESEMNEILKVAKKKNIEIIPLVNTPGHMDAIVTALGELGFTNYRYNGSVRTINLENSNAVEFTKALIKKYATYFKNNGCAIFNMGCDEYANDIYTTGSMGFGNLVTSGKYSLFVEYVNKLAKTVIDVGMTPMAFNDGFYFNNNTQSIEFNSQIMVSFWTSGWSGYQSMNAKNLAGKGHSMINTHGNFYYVLGKSDNFDNNYYYADNFSNTQFMGSVVSNPKGSMFCIWCDVPGAETETEVAKKTRLVLRAMAQKMKGEALNVTEEVVANGFNADGSINTGSVTPEPGSTPVETINLVYDGDPVTRTISGDQTGNVNDGNLDTNIATVGVVRDYAEEKTEKVLGSKVSYDKDGTYTGVLTDNNEHFLKIDSNGNPVSTTKIDDATEFTVTRSTNTILFWSDITYTLYGNGQYLYVDYSNGKYTIKAGSTKNTWAYGSNSGFLDSTNSRYLNYSNGFEAARTNGNVHLYSTTTQTTPAKDDTIVTFTPKFPGTTYVTVGDKEYTIIVAYKQENVNVLTGATKNITVSGILDEKELNTSVATVSVVGTTMTITAVAQGTTSVKVGGVQYNITVTEENLNTVTPLKVEYWITNSRFIDSSNNYLEKVINATDNGIATEQGVEIVSLVPDTNSKDGRTQVYWQSKILDVTKTNTSTSGTELQTLMQGDDETLNGFTFTKVRYWNGEWQVFTTEWISVDRTSTTVTYNNGNETYTGDKNQLVAYYMELININNDNGKSELVVKAADWGTKGDGTGNWGYTPESYRCSVSVQIVYEDATTNPADITAAALKSKTIVYGYWSGGRGLGTMIFTGNGYDIYKVTATTGTMSSTASASNTVTVTNLTWHENEKTVWGADGSLENSVSIGNPAKNPSYESPLDNLAWNTSSYNKNNAILIRVYVRTKVTEDTLKVNYFDEKSPELPFYDYNIAVAEGTLFAANFGMEGSGLVNNTVTNINGVEQTVLSDLTKMTEIGAQYRYSKFNLTRCELSADRKTVNLYYTFDNTASFVIDFGLPITIPYTAINSELENPTINDVAFTSPKYGTVTVGADHAIIYTPTKTVDKIDNFQVTYTGTRVARDGETQGAVTYQVYIIPATNVYYEETFIENNGWSKDTGSTVNQALEKPGAKQNVYGYDLNVANQNANIGYSMGGVYHTTLSLTDLSDTSFMFSNPLTFTFEGTGLDLISACNINTGMLYVEVIGKEKGGAYRALVDTYFRGDDTNIIGNGETVYQVPVVRKLDLPYDMYTVTIKGYLYNKAGAVVKASTNAVAEVNSFNSYMVEEDALSTLVNALAIPGLTEEDIDVIYMDENSILNPNAAVAAADRSMAAYALDVASNAAATAEVYVDGFRVYNPLGESGKVVYNYTDENGIVTQKETYISLNDPTGEHAYNKDNEAGVVYYPVYDFIKDGAVELGGYSDKPGVYIEYDGATGLPYIATYKNQGPQNEIYLAPQSAIAFGINGYVTGNTIQVSARKVTNNAGAFTSYAASVTANATEMYYIVKYDTSLGDEQYNYVVIKNTTDGVLALSALKISNNIKPFMNENLKNQILKDLKPNEGAGFTPQKFIVTMPTTVPENTNFAVNVIASASDVSKVTLTIKANDSNETIYGVYNDYVLKASNSIAVKRKLAKNWSFDETIFFLPEEGQTLATSYTFIFTAYDKSDPAKTITYEQVVTIQ